MLLVGPAPGSRTPFHADRNPFGISAQGTRGHQNLARLAGLNIGIVGCVLGLIFVDADNIRRAIEQWCPGPCFNERQCRDSLYRHLVGIESLSTKKFHIEHPMGTGIADIFVDLDDSVDFGAKVAIELKYDLKTKAERDRLIGQIANYVDVGQVVVVLCGGVNAQHLTAITNRVDEFVSNRLFRKGHVIVKPVTPRLTNGRFISGKVQGGGGADGRRRAS